jgi:hypothetical protein
MSYPLLLFLPDVIFLQSGGILYSAHIELFVLTMCDGEEGKLKFTRIELVVIFFT